MYSLIERLSQELSSQVKLVSTNAANATANATGEQPLAGIAGLSEFAMLWRFISTFAIAGDWVKLFFLGTVLETIRRFASQMWTSIIDSFFLTATFESDDDAYNWMMVWISRQAQFNKARDVQVSTRGWGIDINDYSSRGIYVPGEADVGLEKRPLHFLPSFGLTQTFWYKHHWMRVTRSRRALQDGDNTEVLCIRILARSQAILNTLLLDAKRIYEKEEQHRVSIYTAGSYNDWRRTGSRPKRPMESIVLDEGQKDMILADAREFMASEKWYSERGLPYRRGYLFHGCPGSGKTSLVHALAGQLSLDIYVINLSKKGLDDGGLSELVGDLPARSVALIEEIDAAFTRGVNRDAGTSKDGSDSPAGVTLSGLLASIDGIQASEGRLLFATTNKYFALDPALIRPGRLDVHLEFTFASKNQAEELFKRFFHSTGTTTTTDIEKPEAPHPVVDAKTSLQYVPPKPVNLTETERNTLAKEFAQAMPDKEFPMAAIQGLLLNFKNRPSQVIQEVPGWVEKERSARLARERALKLAEEKEKLIKVEEPTLTDAQQPSPPPETVEEIANSGD